MDAGILSPGEVSVMASADIDDEKWEHHGQSLVRAQRPPLRRTAAPSARLTVPVPLIKSLSQ